MECFRHERILNAANLLTVLRIAMLPMIVWCYRSGDPMGALVLYTAAMLTDVLDGWIARHYQQITSLGKLLDPVSDKLCLLTILGLFVSDGQIPVWFFAVVLAKEIIFAAGSIFALKRGVVVSALPIGKAATAVFVISVIFRFLMQRAVADVLLGLSLLLSIAAMAWYSAVLIGKLGVQPISLSMNNRPLS